MKRWLGWVAIAWLLALSAVALVAYGSPTSSPSLAVRVRDIADAVRCPACQGETVEESQTAIAASIRAIIRQRLVDGQSPAAIEAFLASRYGAQILLSPPSHGVGALAWLAPPLAALSGAVVLVALVVDWRRKGRVLPVRAAERYVERVRSELAADPGE